VSAKTVLRDSLEQVPRIPLAALPTPVVECPRLSSVLGGPRILIKRDDLTGLALGGNKARQLEYVMAEALAVGSDTLIAGANVQSNFCCQLAAAANRCGLRAVLVLFEQQPDEPQGNLLLDYLLGAEMEFHPLEDSESATEVVESVAQKRREGGANPYVIDLHGETAPRAALGYVRCGLELDQQLHAGSVTHLFLANATGVTQAGLLMAARSLEWGCHVVGVSAWLAAEVLQKRIARITRLASGILGSDVRVNQCDVRIVDRYAFGSKLAEPTEVRRAIALLADTEGIFLDPDYTGRAMAALVKEIEEGKITSHDVVLFLHTGGAPTLFAHGSSLLRQ